MSTNLSTIAKEITLDEGGKVSLPKPQVQEVIKLYNAYLREQPFKDVLTLINKRKGK